MGARRIIIQKIHAVMIKKFENPKESFHFYDKNNDGSLDKNEIKFLLKDAGISIFLRSLIANEMIDIYDTSGNKSINWDEFQVAVSELEKDL